MADHFVVGSLGDVVKQAGALCREMRARRAAEGCTPSTAPRIGYDVELHEQSEPVDTHQVADDAAVAELQQVDGLHCDGSPARRPPPDPAEIGAGETEPDRCSVVAGHHIVNGDPQIREAPVVAAYRLEFGLGADEAGCFLFQDRFVVALDARNDSVGASISMGEFSALPYLATSCGHEISPAEAQLDLLGIRRNTEITTNDSPGRWPSRHRSAYTNRRCHYSRSIS